MLAFDFSVLAAEPLYQHWASAARQAEGKRRGEPVDKIGKRLGRLSTKPMRSGQPIYPRVGARNDHSTIHLPIHAA